MTFSEPLYECYSIGLYNSKHHPTNTNVSPTNGPEARCSCEIGYRLLLRYYTDGPWCPITVFFSAALFLPPLFELMLFPYLQDDSYAFKIPLTSILILGCHEDICKKPQLYNLLQTHMLILFKFMLLVFIIICAICCASSLYQILI